MLLPMLLGLAVLLLTAAYLSSAPDAPKSEPVSAEELQAGRTYLSVMAEKDPALVDQVLKQRRAEKLDREREELVQKLCSGEADVWSMFQDFVLLGDSRAVGFYYYKFLDKSRVLADGGNTIRNVAEHMQQIKDLNPSSIFLCYGLNDVSIGYWDTPESYAEEMLEVVQGLQQQLPQARIVISSILPARDPAFERASKWREIPAYSAAVEKLCREKGIAFANNDKIAEEHAALWDPDGIHLQRPFYQYWGSNLIVAALQEQQPGTEADGEVRDHE